MDNSRQKGGEALRAIPPEGDISVNKQFYLKFVLFYKVTLTLTDFLNFQMSISISALKIQYQFGYNDNIRNADKK